MPVAGLPAAAITLEELTIASEKYREAENVFRDLSSAVEGVAYVAAGLDNEVWESGENMAEMFSTSSAAPRDAVLLLGKTMAHFAQVFDLNPDDYAELLVRSMDMAENMGAPVIERDSLMTWLPGGPESFLSGESCILELDDYSANIIRECGGNPHERPISKEIIDKVEERMKTTKNDIERQRIKQLMPVLREYAAHLND